jgi:hypothetical protein
MTQTHGPKFRLQEQYFKESCSHKYFPQVTFPPFPVSSPLSISLKLQFISHQSILFLSKSQLLASAEELHQCLVCKERFQSYSTWIFQIFHHQHSEGV